MASLDEFFAALFGSLGPVGSLLALLLIFAADAALFPALPVEGRRMPGWLERGMQRWTGFLLVRDERVILLNRLAPVVPFVGAFIATLRWDYRRSIAYVAAGGVAKYAVLLFVVFAVGVAYDVGTARWITLGLVVAVVALSFVGSYLVRRRATPPAS